MTAAVVRDAPNPIAVLRTDLQNMEGQFKAALPAHIPVERFMRVVMTALQNNPDLVNKVDRRSLWNSAIKAAQDGLLPDGREGAIVAYGSQAQWMPMIAGIRKKVRNSGEIATWEVQVVHERDEFEFELGDNPFIKHRPDLSADPGGVIAAYSVATLKTGEKSREVMSISDIEKVRSRSKAKNNGPWITDYGEMCRKTVARRHSKVLPMSTDLDDLLRRDDELYDLEAAKNDAKAAQQTTLSGRLDVLAQIPSKVGETVDAQTGEVATAATDESASTQEGTTAQTHPAAGQPAPEPEPSQRSSGQPGAGAAQQEPAATGAKDKPGATAKEPKTEAAYAAYFRAWLAAATDVETIEKTWASDKKLRNSANVSGDIRDGLEEEKNAKLASLKGANG